MRGHGEGRPPPSGHAELPEGSRAWAQTRWPRQAAQPAQSMEMWRENQTGWNNPCNSRGKHPTLPASKPAESPGWHPFKETLLQAWSYASLSGIVLDNYNIHLFQGENRE